MYVDDTSLLISINKGQDRAIDTAYASNVTSSNNVQQKQLHGINPDKTILLNIPGGN